MTAAYRYPIEACDVDEKLALAEFRAKRLEWLNWLKYDEVHAIWPQISSALWSDVAFRTVADIARASAESALNNSVLTEALIQGYFATQVLTIRRLFDKRGDVISLYRLLGDIETSLPLFTREIYVSHDGLPYDYEAVQQRKMMEVLAAGGGPFWGATFGPDAYFPAERAHRSFDKLCGIGSNPASRTDHLSISVITTLRSWLDECGASEIVTWSHKMLAHAADEASRGQVQIEAIGPTLEKIPRVHRALVRVAEVIANYVLCDSSHGAVVPVPQFDQFEKFDRTIAGSEQLPALRNLWYRLSKERDAWLDDTWQALLDSLTT